MKISNIIFKLINTNKQNLSVRYIFFIISRFSNQSPIYPQIILLFLYNFNLEP